MAIIDYQTIPPSRPIHLRPWLAAAFLVVCAIAYKVACNIEIARSPDPLPDVYWPVVCELWPIAIPLFLLIAPRGWRAWAMVGGYAVVAACIYGSSVWEPIGAEGWMIPAHSTGNEATINGIIYSILFVPEAAIVMALCQLVARPIIREITGQSPAARRLAKSAVVAAICVFAVIAPIIYRQTVAEPAQARGRASADAEWAAGTAHQYADGPGNSQSGNFFASSDYSFTTGLRIEDYDGGGETAAFEQGAYEARVEELVHQRGIPPFSKLSQFVSDADLQSMLDSNQMRPIAHFPYQVTPGVSVTNPHSIMGKDGTGSGNEDLNPDPVFVGKLPQYPGIVFVRFKRDRVDACTNDGVLESMQRP